MTVEQIIKYLRTSVSIQDPEGSTADSVYLSMTDEDLMLYVNVALSRNFPEVMSLNYLPNELVYPVVLIAKKELYFSLATKDAPLFDIGADNNNYLKRSQRFDHYMKMVAQIDDEYEKYMENGGAGANTLTSFDVLLPDRSNTKRNYEKGAIPALLVNVDSVTSSTAEIQWSAKMSKFFSYKVYVSNKPIVDIYNPSNPISSEAKLLTTIKDAKHTALRIKGLQPDTLYYVAVSATEMSSLTGYAETSFTTDSLVGE